MTSEEIRSEAPGVEHAEVTESAETAPKLESRSFWNKRYEDDTAPEEWYCNSEYLEPVLRWAFELASTDRADGLELVLNIGCGRSDLNVKLAEMIPSQVVGIDVSLPAMHEMGAGQGAAVHFVAADALRLPFRDASFDAIVDKGTSDWVVLSLLIAEDRDEKLTILRSELLRVLRPGGRLVVVTGLGGTDEDPKLFLKGNGDSGAHWSDVKTRRLRDLGNSYRCHRLTRSART
eukprot:TRINITY_DN33344_c0_g1_i1.p1 TRINITY_DN33344_c0_g1~~TRINITY_DN33344_c0_g1_i1.p1  ORF type:complete len:251 (+),score=48.06 TRINITY_DN33344_c0_g1_i1:55-753(+)